MRDDLCHLRSARMYAILFMETGIGFIERI